MDPTDAVAAIAAGTAFFAAIGGATLLVVIGIRNWKRARGVA